jgi:CubicO group peptidase (beta-lactamase class C family)
MRFGSASITKVFTAVATLQFIEGGAFDLDTSAIEYLGLDGTGISTAVTPYHLLTHTSGIADDAGEEAGERLRGSVQGSSQLRIRRDGRFPAAVRRPAAQLRSGHRLSLLHRHRDDIIRRLDKHDANAKYAGTERALRGAPRREEHFTRASAQAQVLR